MPSRIFLMLILLLPLLSACVTEGQLSSLPTHIAGMEPAGGTTVVFTPPLGDAAQEKTITQLLENAQAAGQQDGILMTKPYRAASGNLCTLLSAQATAGHWTACRNQRNQWVVKPSLLREDAMYGMSR
jgi:hypothetical protein